MNKLNYFAIPGMQNTTSLQPEYILQTLCDKFKIPESLIKSPSRKQEIKDCRQVYMICAWIFSSYSSAYIGNVVNRDHATVVHARRLYNLDNTLKELVDECINLFNLSKKREL
jgi:chromosomal replication initiation ATPase DnaA